MRTARLVTVPESRQTFLQDSPACGKRARHRAFSEEDLAVGVFFLPRENSDNAKKAQIIAEAFLATAALALIGWRDVPTEPGALGQQAIDTMPVIKQLLLQRPDGLDSDSLSVSST